MKTRIYYKCLCLFGFVIPLVLSCIPENIKDQMDQNLGVAQTMLADQEFKKAIAHIELHKLRNGAYPRSLNELQFLSALDSTTLKFVEYQKLDSGYELNLNFKFPSFTGNVETQVQLKYPAEFWKGLGCVRSNVRQEI